MMLTFRAGNVAALTVFLFLAAACSREQQDWRSAEAADTAEGYSHFLERHPDSELATEARTRVAQLAEDHEWQQASQADTADAYRQFMTQHPNGKWAQEARIRIQNFALSGLPPAAPPMAETPDAGAAGSNSSATASPAAGGFSAAPSSTAASSAAQPSAAASASPAGSPSGAASGAAAQAFAAPGELAQPVGSARPSTVALSTPYVSVPNPAKPAAALANATAANIATTNSAVNNATATNTAATTAANNTTSYGIQLGAFASAAAANNAWQQLTARFGAQLQGLSAQVVPASTTTGALFRLQALVGDESRARALCDLLKKQSQACVPVLPH